MNDVSIQIETRLGSPDLPADHSLHKVIAAALQERAVFPNADGAQAFWPAGYFHLDQVSLYRQASEDERQAIVQRCSQNVLAESYYIERCGMYFAAKMGLLAETTQERMLYSLFNADEATHFSWIKNFVTDEAAAEYLHNPFIQVLDELLQREDRTTLTYLVQIILEGWGLQHYRALAKDCLDEKLRLVLATILKDEARHHGSGLILFHEQAPAQLAAIVEALGRFFRLVQTGPQMVVSAIERVKGHLTKAQKARLFVELDGERQTMTKINTLRSLVQTADFGAAISARLERQGLYKPLSAQACAAV